MAIFRKKYHRFSANIYQWILIKLYTNAGYDNISSKFDFQDPGLKVKFTVAIFRKKKQTNFVIALKFLNSEPILIKLTTKFMVCNIVLICYTYYKWVALKFHLFLV